MRVHVHVCEIYAAFACLCCSWGSGANVWGPDRDDQFAKPTHYDGMLEVVGVTGVVHVGQMASGLRSGIRIAQGGHVSRDDIASLCLVAAAASYCCNPRFVFYINVCINQTVILRDARASV